MSIECYEKWAGITADLGDGKERYATQFVITGTNNTSDIVAALMNSSPPAVVGRSQLLLRKPFNLTEKGGGVWYADAVYESEDSKDDKEDDDNNVQPLAFKVSWDTTGETVKKTVSDSLYDYAGDISDSTRAIGWDGKKVNGVDVYVPTLKISIDIFYAPAAVNIGAIQDWARNTGKVNLLPWLGFQNFEVLFLGCSGDQTFSMLNGKATKPVPVTFKFACSENIPANSIVLSPALTVQKMKFGWEYLDVFFGEKTEGVAPNQITTAVPLRYKIHTIYKSADFRAFTGIG